MSTEQRAHALQVRIDHRVGDVRISVAFCAKPGITVLFGPSGSGKSTLLSTIAGLTVADSGLVRLGDTTWLDTEQRVFMPVQARKIAFVFQAPALFPHMTALANVMYGMDRTTPHEKSVARARELLARWDVAALAERKPGKFSGGEAQRVALARAFATSPQVILMDEPFSALDDARRRTLANGVKEMVASLGVPAIFVTHSVREAEALGDHVVLLEDGKIAQEGPPAQVLSAVSSL
jgi:molybdate transport system ATP-binding protein